MPNNRFYIVMGYKETMTCTLFPVPTEEDAIKSIMRYLAEYPGTDSAIIYEATLFKEDESQIFGV